MFTSEIEAALRPMLSEIDNAITCNSLMTLNRWFAAPGFVSARVCLNMRRIPPELFSAIGTDDPRARIHENDFAVIYTLELADVGVNKIVRRRGVAKLLIAGLIVLAQRHGLYFVIENVISNHLYSYLSTCANFVQHETEPDTCVHFFNRYGATLTATP